MLVGDAIQPGTKPTERLLAKRRIFKLRSGLTSTNARGQQMIDKLASGSKLVAALAGAWAFSLPALAQGIVTPGAQAFDKAATSKTHDMMPFANPSGYAATFSTTGFIDRDNPFFQSLGTNGRRQHVSPAERWLDRDAREREKALLGDRRNRSDLSPERRRQLTQCRGGNRRGAPRCL